MAPWQTAVLCAYGLVVAVAFVRHFLLTGAIRKLRFLTPRSPRMEGKDLPLVSILVPAKDEAATIERCLRGLLAQDYPRIEILVVDDRSEDETPRIVERIAAETGRVALVRIDALPPGWTGKTHALHQCQKLARGEWLLFVDADTRLLPECLSVVLRDAIDHKVVLESILPALESSSFWERVVQPFAGICLMVLFPIGRVNRSSDPMQGFANGQFILIRRSAYDAIGGHEGVRDKFVEDIHLGRNIRRAGLTLRVVMGVDVASVRMYSSLGGLVRGWSRILYSAVDFRPGKLYALLAATLLFSVLPYVVLAACGVLFLSGSRSEFLSWLLGLAVVHEILQITLMYRIYGLSRSDRRFLAFRPLAVAVMLYVFARTIWMCRSHRVEWRGTRYGKEIQAAGGASAS